jgi:hypothetical protein
MRGARRPFSSGPTPRGSSPYDSCSPVVVRITVPASPLVVQLVGDSRYIAVGFSDIDADRCTGLLNLAHD